MLRSASLTAQSRQVLPGSASGGSGHRNFYITLISTAPQCWCAPRLLVCKGHTLAISELQLHSDSAMSALIPSTRLAVRVRSSQWAVCIKDPCQN